MSFTTSRDSAFFLSTLLTASYLTSSFQSDHHLQAIRTVQEGFREGGSRGRRTSFKRCSSLSSLFLCFARSGGGGAVICARGDQSTMCMLFSNFIHP